MKINVAFVLTLVVLTTRRLRTLTMTKKEERGTENVKRTSRKTRRMTSLGASLAPTPNRSLQKEKPQKRRLVLFH